VAAVQSILQHPKLIFPKEKIDVTKNGELVIGVLPSNTFIRPEKSSSLITISYETLCEAFTHYEKRHDECILSDDVAILMMSTRIYTNYYYIIYGMYKFKFGTCTALKLLYS